MDEDIMTSMARSRFGIAQLHPRQRLVISNILQASGYYGRESAAEAPDRQLVIFPTGMGKSVCFMLPALLIEAVTVVIFPLLSLMNDQKRRFDEAGIPCGVIRGGQSREERNGIYERLADGTLKALLLNPETFRTGGVLRQLERCGAIHLVIDEAHTIPEWGESFRPACLEIARAAEALPVRQLTAFTATAGKRIIGGITDLLFGGTPPLIISELPDRPNIHYRVVPALSRCREIARLLGGTLPLPAVVFCRSRVECEMTAAALRTLLRGRAAGGEIRFYHAGLEREEKERVAGWFFSSRGGILSATTAYGLGVDKPDIRTVVHHRPAPSVEAFLQESGRAGRDRRPAWSAVILTPEDLREEGRPGSCDPRARALLSCFAGNGQCRREALLALLDARPPSCGGCDVCDGTATEQPAGWAEAMLLFRLMPLRWSLKEAAEILSRVVDPWDREEAHESLKLMVECGALRRSGRGPWRGLIWPAGYPFSRPRSFLRRSGARDRSPPPLCR